MLVTRSTANALVNAVIVPIRPRAGLRNPVVTRPLLDNARVFLFRTFSWIEVDTCPSIA